MKISIIHPSRGRAKQAMKTAQSWIQKASTNGIHEYIIAIEPDNLDDYRSTFGLNLGFIKLSWTDSKTAIQAINSAAIKATGDLLIVVSDDFDCPKHWDTLLLQHLAGRKDFCVKTQDGIQPTLMTLPIMDRTYYNRFGYIYHPEYEHMYSDQEMTAVAHMLGRVVTLPLMFPHNHYSTGKFTKDAISLKNDKTYPQGRKVFEAHLRNNFGIDNPVCSYRSIKWH